ncbi:uncharacterized protein LAJ45_02388 [Morchella importuna]|uniref:uncharacterized protein n=1 Tax=Morchella importuna TaxID=1174673 RepID=UPI001E8DCCEF|nr:uncharacterized protein LAJ45_02388 [Morchella importuna]KAH8153575.1 hypothetical protein LAJ45_02388 [Morchella importuna]
MRQVQFQRKRVKKSHDSVPTTRYSYPHSFMHDLPYLSSHNRTASITDNDPGSTYFMEKGFGYFCTKVSNKQHNSICKSRAHVK